MSKYVIGAAAAMALAAAAVAICSFDASNVDIARPPSIEKQLSNAPAGDVAPPPAITSFIADPLDRYAVYQLSREPAGNPSVDQLRLLFLAAGRSSRDVEIQVAAISQLLKEEKYALALERLDGLMRADHALRPKLYDALVVFAQSAASRRALVDLLAQEPPWRKDFLSYLPRAAIDVQTASTLIAEMRATASAPQSSELAPFIDRLIADGAIGQAYSLWLNSLTEAQLARAGYIYNGDFEAKLAQLGSFDWTVMRAKNVVARTTPNAADNRGMVLEVAFVNAQISYRNIFQRLMLPAGRYSLTGYYKANDLENDRGLVWRVYCVIAGQKAFGKRLGESPAMKGTQDWTAFEINLDIPDRDCGAQILQLELNAQAKLDQRVTGVLRFDDLKIDRKE
jgi:hypothetical protein